MGVGGGGVESKFSVQLRPKLNNISDLLLLDIHHIELFHICFERPVGCTFKNCHNHF